MAEPTACCAGPGVYCGRVGTLFNLAGVHVLDVTWREQKGKRPAGLRLRIETSVAETGCPDCGVIAQAHGRRVRTLADIPAFGAPVGLHWWQHRYRRAELACPVGGFREESDLGPPRAQSTRREA